MADKPAASSATGDPDTLSPAGAVAPMATTKAGCGIRIDPDVLNEDVGFDFSAAADYLVRLEEDADSGSDSRSAEVSGR